MYKMAKATTTTGSHLPNGDSNGVRNGDYLWAPCDKSQLFLLFVVVVVTECVCVCSVCVCASFRAFCAATTTKTTQLEFVMFA